MTASSSSSFIDDFISIFLLSLWCSSRRWPEFTMYVIFVVIVLLIMIPFCTDLFTEEKKEMGSWSTCSFVFHICNFFWVSVWCFPRRRWSNPAGFVMFVVIWTVIIIIPLCIDLFKKKMEIWSSFVFAFMGIFWVFLSCLSTCWLGFTMSVIFVVIVLLNMIPFCNDLCREKMKMPSLSTTSSCVFHFCNFFWVSVWCFSRRWPDLAVFVMFLVTGTVIIIMPLCINLFSIKKRMAVWYSFVFVFMGIFWVSLWCFSTCWLEFTMYVMFVVSVTSNITLLFCPGKKIRREERETMRGLLSNWIDEDQLQPGDHIYTWRHGWIYAHHGIYGRDGKVIHLTRGGGHKFGTRTTLDRGGARVISSSHSMDNAMNPCRTCGSELNRGGARVISSCMECFLSGGNLYLYHYDVSMPFFLIKFRGGTCSLAPSDPHEKVLKRAESLLPKDHNSKMRNSSIDYDLMSNNCEDFAIYCKTGPCVCFDICPNTNLKTGDPNAASVQRSGQAVTLVATFIVFLLYRSTGLAGAIIGSGYYFFVRVIIDVQHLKCNKKVLRERFVSPSVSEELEAVAEVANESKSLYVDQNLEAGTF